MAISIAARFGRTIISVQPGFRCTQQYIRTVHSSVVQQAKNTGVLADFAQTTTVIKKSPLSTMPGIKQCVEDVVKSEEDKRSYRGLELDNGLRVLLISDPDTDKSAAALDVHIGHMSDPKELPGLAHFCEHMLFLGTERYPDENEYNKYLSQNGGSCNAFTSSDHTNYYFDIAPDKLEGALDRFSQFFHCPLFTESATEREVKAVNSEHEKNIPNDAWRMNMIERATANPLHDFSKFGTGNKETLDTIPKERGMVVRDELLKFHQTWYSSNIMAVAVLGRQDLDTLQSMIVKLFGDVANKEVKVPEWPEAPFLDDQLRKITYIVPVKDTRSLSITWGIPDLSEEYKSQPASYLGHLLGHEGPGSLLSELKSRGWVNNLVGGQKAGSKGFGFMVVNVDLTEEGIEHIDDIIQLVFQYLELLRKEGPQEWVFQECRDLNAMQFRFKDKERPQSYVCGLAGHLHDHPLEEVLTGGYLLSEWKPELITSVLDQLTPERVRVTVTGQRYKDRCETVEKWYGAKYCTEPIEQSTLERWKSCGVHENLRLPDKNEFIPTNFKLVERDPENRPHPVIVEEDSLGRLWFKQDDEFLLPKTCINIEMRSPIAYSDPHNANLTYMFAKLFQDELNEYVYDAELAGLGYSLANTKSGIALAIKGYSDKQKVLLEKIMDKLTLFKVNEKRFGILKEAYARALKNFHADQPHQHAMYYNSVVLAERIWPKEDLVSTLDTLTAEELTAFIPRLLANLRVDCLVYGNSTLDQAKDIYTYVCNRLKEDCKARPLLPSQLMKEREIQLTDQHCIFQTTNSIHKASCIEVYYQCGLQDTRPNMLLELFAQVIKESCFDQLRTKEQLGYIVFSGVRRSNGVQGLRIIVQSEKHPEYLDTRIEEFIANLEETLQSMSDEEYSAHIEALASKRLEKPKKLSVKNGRYWSEILSQHYNFDRDNIEVESLRALTRPELLDFYTRHIALSSAERRKLACHVISTAPDGAGSIPADPPADNSTPAVPAAVRVVEDITEFKCSQPLFPLSKPFVKLDTLKRATS